MALSQHVYQCDYSMTVYIQRGAISGYVFCMWGVHEEPWTQALGAYIDCVCPTFKRKMFFYVSVLWFMDSHWNRHTHTHKPTLMGWQSALAELRWTNGNLGKEECAWRWSKRGRQNPQQATPVVLANTSVSVWKSVHLHKKVVGVVTVELYEYV